jgi:hypothetical protein
VTSEDLEEIVRAAQRANAVLAFLDPAGLLKVRARTGCAVGDGKMRTAEEELRRVLDAPFDLPGRLLRVGAWILERRPPEASRVTLGIDVAVLQRIVHDGHDIKDTGLVVAPGQSLSDVVIVVDPDQ